MWGSYELSARVSSAQSLRMWTGVAVDASYSMSQTLQVSSPFLRFTVKLKAFKFVSA